MIIFKPSPQITSLYGLKEISLKLEAFLKELTEVLTPMLSTSSHIACFIPLREIFRLPVSVVLKICLDPFKKS